MSATPIVSLYEANRHRTVFDTFFVEQSKYQKLESVLTDPLSYDELYSYEFLCDRFAMLDQFCSTTHDTEKEKFDLVIGLLDLSPFIRAIPYRDLNPEIIKNICEA